MSTEAVFTRIKKLTCLVTGFSKGVFAATIVPIQNKGQSQIDPTTPTPQSSLRSQPTTVPSLPAGFRKTLSQHNYILLIPSQKNLESTGTNTVSPHLFRDAKFTKARRDAIVETLFTKCCN